MTAKRTRRVAIFLALAAMAPVAAVTHATATDRQPVTAAAVDNRPEFVIAVMGDSYAAGEGSPDIKGNHDFGGGFTCLPGACFPEKWWSENTPVTFPQGDNAGWVEETQRCHRSTRATGPQAAMRIQERFPNVKIVVLDYACSGAEIGVGMLQGYRGTEPEFRNKPLLKPQIQALEDDISGTSRDVDAMVMNIGGNDALFGTIVKTCIGLGSCAADNALRDQFAERTKLANPSDINAIPQPAFPDPNATVEARFLALAKSINGSGSSLFPRLISAKPSEVYLTAEPDATKAGPPTPRHAANPENFCDGTQTTDPVYSRFDRAEAEMIFQFERDGMNGNFSRAATRHGWNSVGGTFGAFRDHGLCAGSASFFRTLGDALRFQGNDLPAFDLPLGTFIAPFVSSGIAHPNDAGFKAMGDVVADAVEEQVRMRFTAPVLNLDRVGSNGAYTLTWVDPSPAHAPETRWELEITTPGKTTAHLFSDGSPMVNGTVTESPLPSGRLLSWPVPVHNPVQTVRLRGCRKAVGFYCGAFSNALVVPTVAPGTPSGIVRVANAPILRNKSIGIKWAPAPNTLAGTTYEVSFGRLGLACVFNPGLGRDICHPGVENRTKTVVTGTSFRIGSLAAPLTATDAYAFAVRACNAAGCSPFTPDTVFQVSEKTNTPGT